jgi:hypothetical protein
MFMQAFRNWFDYDLTASTTTFSMCTADTTPIAGVYIGSNTFTAGSDPFTLLFNTTQQIYINTDLAQYQTTIGASLAF